MISWQDLTHTTHTQPEPGVFLPPTVPRHYPFVTRLALTLFHQGGLSNVRRLEVEPEFGYAARLQYRNGSVRMTSGNDLGINSAAASAVVRDKVYAKHFLTKSGFSCVPGEAFLLPWWADTLRSSSARHGMATFREVSAVEPRFGRTRRALYVKPVDGLQGINVWRCESISEVHGVLRLYDKERVKVALIEECINLPDYRLVVLGDEVILAYQRVPLTVMGNGRSTVNQLLTDLQERYNKSGRNTLLDIEDARIERRLSRLGLRHDTIAPDGKQIQLHDISNLSAGGTAVDYTDRVAERWRELALCVAQSFGLRFCGVDLACLDIADDRGDYYVFEVNATPGLDHYLSTREMQARIVESLYARVLNAEPDHGFGCDR